MAPYNPPLNNNYSEIDVSHYPEGMMWKVVGKEGRNFYDITTYARLAYVWYNDERKIVELWGSESAFDHGARDKIIHVLGLYRELETCLAA